VFSRSRRLSPTLLLAVALVLVVLPPLAVALVLVVLPPLAVALVLVVLPTLAVALVLVVLPPLAVALVLVVAARDVSNGGSKYVPQFVSPQKRPSIPLLH
jgi:hypothetical protein